MSAEANVIPRPGLIERLLDRWFAMPGARAGADPEDTAGEAREDLRAALQALSLSPTGALSAEYAHHLIDRHAARMGERG